MAVIQQIRMIENRWFSSEIRTSQFLLDSVYFIFSRLWRTGVVWFEANHSYILIRSIPIRYKVCGDGLKAETNKWEEGSLLKLSAYNILSLNWIFDCVYYTYVQAKCKFFWCSWSSKVKLKLSTSILIFKQKV